MHADLRTNEKSKNVKSVHTQSERNSFIEKLLWVELLPRCWLCVPVFNKCNDVDEENRAGEQQLEGKGRDEDSLAVDLLVERILHLDQLPHLPFRSARCTPHHTSVAPTNPSQRTSK